MYRFLFIFILLGMLSSCESDLALPEICMLEGRWQVDGFDNTLYEFHDGLRYTIYSDSSGVFGTRDEAIPNPHEYHFEGDSLIIDLNFGNKLSALPIFECNCNILVLSTNQGFSDFFKEGYDVALCDD